MLKTNSTLVTKNQLLDYISKRDFNDFVVEMRDFRDGTEIRFSAIDKRLNSIDRRFDKLSEDFRIQTGAILDQFKEHMQINREYMQGVEERLMNRLQVLEDKIK